MKIALTALILAAAPLAAFAQCAGEHRDQQAMSCISGTHWDQESQSCVPTVAS